MRKWLPLIALFVFCAASWWVVTDLSDPDTVGDSVSGDLPEFYMEKFSTTTMDENGRPKHTLTGERMTIYPNQTKEVEQPHLIVYEENRPPWHATSERVEVSADDTLMVLYGDVRLWRNNEAGVLELEMETRQLSVFRDKDYAVTDEPVVIRTPSTKTTGTGMRVYKESRRLKLLSGVKTIYERNEN